MLTKVEAASYRRQLLQLANRLNGDQAQLKDEALRSTGGEAGGGLSDVPLHLADLGSQGFDEDVTLDLLESEEQLIDEVNDALTRLDEGAFGRCEACCRPIPKTRLWAVPYTRYCVACARKVQEQGVP
jgi:RNA polymerase-binding transcription factor DksA